MARKDCTKVWALSPGEIVELDDARDTLLRVTRGVLWVTMEHDTRDIVLNAGDTFVVDRNGVTLAEAQGSTAVRVQPHIGGSQDRFAPVGWVASLMSAWLRRMYRRAGSPRRIVPFL